MFFQFWCLHFDKSTEFFAETLLLPYYDSLVVLLLLLFHEVLQFTLLLSEKGRLGQKIRFHMIDKVFFVL